MYHEMAYALLAISSLASTAVASDALATGKVKSVDADNKTLSTDAAAKDSTFKYRRQPRHQSRRHRNQRESIRTNEEDDNNMKKKKKKKKKNMAYCSNVWNMTAVESDGGYRHLVLIWAAEMETSGLTLPSSAFWVGEIGRLWVTQLVCV